MQPRFRYMAPLTAVLWLFAGTAAAHVAADGPAVAGENQVLSFSIGHGCEGDDTVRLEITIPEEVTGVRAMRSLPGEQGNIQLNTNDAGIVTSVVWTKGEARAADDLRYTGISIRASMPDSPPFTTLLFPAQQTCLAEDGTESTVDWAAAPGETGNPAPSVTLLPAKAPGWNQYETTVAIDDLSVFDGAEIVWVGDAAYSANPTLMGMIESEDGVSVLSTIESGSTIWVKY